MYWILLCKCLVFVFLITAWFIFYWNNVRLSTIYLMGNCTASIPEGSYLPLLNNAESLLKTSQLRARAVWLPYVASFCPFALFPYTMSPRSWTWRPVQWPSLPKHFQVTRTVVALQVQHTPNVEAGSARPHTSTGSAEFGKQPESTVSIQLWIIPYASFYFNGKIS